MTLNRVELALQNIKQAREYTLELIDDFDDDQWLAMPGGVTNLAWQVGHLTVAQFGLCLVRLCDMDPQVREVMPRSVRKKYGKGTTPSENPDENASLEEIRSAFQQVYERSVEEIPRHSETECLEPLSKPHPMFDSKLAALEFCAKHEMIHAGQIGFLRRLLGKDPLR